MKVGFDIGGVLSKYPTLFQGLVRSLLEAKVEVFVITDMPDLPQVYAMLDANGFGTIPRENVRSADYTRHGEGCKAELMHELALDLFIDDFIGYLALPGQTVQLLVMPNPYVPYWSETWKNPGAEFEFGRKSYTKKD